MENDIKIEKKPVINKKNIIIAVVGIFILLTVGIIIFRQLSTSPATQTSVVPKSYPAFLYFSPPSIKLLQKKQSAVTSEIVLDTQGKGVSIVQMELSYDPTMISNVSISKNDDVISPFSEFNVDQAVVNQATGKAFITLSVNNTNTDLPKIGKGKLATVKYDISLNKEKAVIQITPLTALITKGTEVKFEKTDLEITLIQAANTPR